jgi:hypothetical protein
VLLPTRLLTVALAAAILDGGSAAPGAVEQHAVLPLESFTVFKQDSGPVNYYAVLEEGGTSFLRASYVPPLRTVVLYAVVPEEARQKVKQVSWRWRVHTLPKGANDCGPGFPDSAASVFLAFKSGMKLKVVKYVWSTLGAKGSSCQSTRGWFFDRDTVLLEAGGPLDVWKSVEVDPRLAFVKHYGGTLEDVPDFVGIGLLTDGDQSDSPAQADYADFVARW